MSTPRVTAHALDLDESERYCTCCKKPLGGRIAWLELDQRTQTYHDRADVPSERSQGWFPFGMICAKKMLAIAASKPPHSGQKPVNVREYVAKL